MTNRDELARRADAAVNRLAKWRSVFAGWQLGTRTDNDPECQAVRDHREVTILLRAEVNALTALLIRARVFSDEDLTAQMIDEAEHLSHQYEKKFPGMEATEHGIAYDLAKIREHGTMGGWRL